MQTALKGTVGVLVAVILAALVAGCGSSGGGSTSTSAAQQKSADQKDGSAEFRGPGIATEIVEFGNEASETLRKEAGPVLARNLKARADGNWSEQCATLAAKEAKKLGKGSASADHLTACEEGLRKLGTPLKKTAAARADTFDGTIDAMRVKGDVAYAIYHGTDGTDYMMPMEHEHGQWKVAAIETVTLN